VNRYSESRNTIRSEAPRPHLVLRSRSRHRPGQPL